MDRLTWLDSRTLREINAINYLSSKNLRRYVCDYDKGDFFFLDKKEGRVLAVIGDCVNNSYPQGCEKGAKRQNEAQNNNKGGMVNDAEKQGFSVVR